MVLKEGLFLIRFCSKGYIVNWRCKIIPKKRKQVPNYIVVDARAQVMAKAVYTKKVSDKLEMCSDCFSTEHFKWSFECSGPGKWSEYCEEFRLAWEENSLENDEASDEDVRLQGSMTEETRVGILNKTLVKDMEKLETERDKLQDEVNTQIESLEEVQSLKEELKTLRKENEQVEALKQQLVDIQHEKELLEKEVEESNIMIKEKHITMRKHASQNGVMSDFDNEVDFEEEEAFDVAAEPDVGDVPDHSEKEPLLENSSAKEPPPAEEPPPVHKLVDDAEASSSGVKRARDSPGDSPTSKKKGKFPSDWL